MSKLNSPSSNNSATSSETSETQSVDDNTPGFNTRAVKNWKRMKDEGDKERPPWRAVSVSTLPKADKNALLRAKLLDASRRLRLSKLSVAIQVDLPILRPSRTVGLPAQPGLITKSDVSILTDGSITLKKENPGNFILTHSASQMTEAVVGVDTATQTLLPRSTTRFLEAYLSNNPYNRDHFTESERNLLDQIRDMRKIDEDLRQRSHSFDEMSEDSLTSCGEKTELKQHFEEVCKSSGSLLKPTLSSWHFEYPVEDDVPWKPYTRKPTPWSSFSNTDIEDRLATMKLQPIVGNARSPYATQEIALNLELFSAVEELINESNNLVDTFNHLSSIAGPDVKLQKIPPLESIEIKYLSEYWGPIVEKYDEKIKKLTSELTHPTFMKVQKISLADYDKDAGKNPAQPSTIN